MPLGNRIVVFGIGRIGKSMPIISTEHLHLCDEKLHIVKLPKENNVIPSIIEQRNFEITPDMRVIFYKDSKSLCDIYKKVQRKYYPEKDVYVGDRKQRSAQCL